MIISIQDKTKKASIEISDETDIHGMLTELTGLLIAYGFHPDSVKTGFINKAEELEG